LVEVGPALTLTLSKRERGFTSLPHLEAYPNLCHSEERSRLVGKESTKHDLGRPFAFAQGDIGEAPLTPGTKYNQPMNLLHIEKPFVTLLSGLLPLPW
jgi:hypothetical protein